jgi:hypothetical protein
VTPQSAEPLTSVTAVRAAVIQVKNAVLEGDYEKAHSRERALLLGALEAIASSNAQAGHIAAEALTVTEIDYPRWMA